MSWWLFVRSVLRRFAYVRELEADLKSARDDNIFVGQQLQEARDDIGSLNKMYQRASEERREWRQEAEALQQAIAVLGAEADSYEIARQEDAPPF